MSTAKNITVSIHLFVSFLVSVLHFIGKMLTKNRLLAGLWFISLIVCSLMYAFDAAIIAHICVSAFVMLAMMRFLKSFKNKGGYSASAQPFNYMDISLWAVSLIVCIVALVLALQKED